MCKIRYSDVNLEHCGKFFEKSFSNRYNVCLPLKCCEIYESFLHLSVLVSKTAKLLQLRAQHFSIVDEGKTDFHRRVYAVGKKKIVCGISVNLFNEWVSYSRRKKDFAVRN